MRQVMRRNNMEEYASDELSNALQVVTSTMSRCEKMQPKFAEGTSQSTLLKNRIKAMYISKALITGGCEIKRYSKEELMSALKPVESVISKCESGQRKHEVDAPQHKRFQKMIDAMDISKRLLLNEINKRD
jgi:CxxC motif-containing protein